MNLKAGMLALIVGMAMIAMISTCALNIQEQIDNNVKSIEESDTSDKYCEVSLDIQTYASDMNISIDKAIDRFKLVDVARKLQVGLSTKETETFAGMWIEHTPKFKFVVRFTGDNGDKKIRPYLLKYPELKTVTDVRAADMSLVELEKLQENISYSIDALNISINSGINVYENCVEIYVKKDDYNLLKDALQKMELSDKVKYKVKVILVKSLAEPVADIYGGLSSEQCTFGFSVIKSSVYPNVKGVTTAGHCSNVQSYNGVNLPLQSEIWRGSYDIQWHTAPGYNIVNKIQVSSSGSTRNVNYVFYRGSQVNGERVCKYGMTTKYTCGYISDKNFKPSAYDPTNPSNAPTYIRVKNTAGYNVVADSGDSGGPWFVRSGSSSAIAYGTTVAKLEPGTNGMGSDGIYMAVDYLESGLGVSVMT